MRSRLASFPSPRPLRERRRKRMSKSCKGIAMELLKCLSETDCIKVQNMPYKECTGEKVPCITNECVGLRDTYFNCKRGQVNQSSPSRENGGTVALIREKENGGKSLHI